MQVFLRILMVSVAVACTQVEPPTPEVSLLRNPTAPFGSQADVQAIDFQGEWVVRQARAGQWPNGAQTVRFRVGADKIVLAPAAHVCDQHGLCHGAEAEPIVYAPTKPGRWVAEFPTLAQAGGAPHEIWVLWFDFDRRTVALGDPDGKFVTVLDRTAQGGGDRIVAAREILDWYGYDLSQVIVR